jgi:hypothetical protein
MKIYFLGGLTIGTGIVGLNIFLNHKGPISPLTTASPPYQYPSLRPIDQDSYKAKPAPTYPIGAANLLNCPAYVVPLVQESALFAVIFPYPLR